MVKGKASTEPDNRTAAEILQTAPPAKRAALIRAAQDEIQELLAVVHDAVGTPKEDGRWNSQVCLKLEDVRQRFLHPSRTKHEDVAMV